MIVTSYRDNLPDQNLEVGYRISVFVYPFPSYAFSLTPCVLRTQLPVTGVRSPITKTIRYFTFFGMLPSSQPYSFPGRWWWWCFSRRQYGLNRYRTVILVFRKVMYMYRNLQLLKQIDCDQRLCDRTSHVYLGTIYSALLLLPIYLIFSPVSDPIRLSDSFFLLSWTWFQDLRSDRPKFKFESILDTWSGKV